MNRKYKCMTCGHSWEGRRLMTGEDGKAYRYTDPPLRGGMTECVLHPKCKSLYVEWVNADEVLAALGRYWERT